MKTKTAPALIGLAVQHYRAGLGDGDPGGGHDGVDLVQLGRRQGRLPRVPPHLGVADGGQPGAVEPTGHNHGPPRGSGGR